MLADGAGDAAFATSPVRTLELVRWLAVLREIEAEDLFLLWHAEPDHRIHDLEDDEGHRPAEDPGNRHRDDLGDEQAGVAVEQAVLASRVHGRRGEDAR